MKTYYDMINSGLIDFKKIMLDKYSAIGLDEVDCVLLIKIYEGMKNGYTHLDVDRISKKMSISSDELSERIVKLVNDDFISIEMEDMKSPETISLDSLFHKLAYSLESKEVKNNKNELSDTVKDVAGFIERELNKILSPSELQVIRRWFYDYKYTKDEVLSEVLNAMKYKNRGINYIDSSLYRKHHEVTKTNNDGSTLELFKKVYEKK